VPSFRHGRVTALLSERPGLQRVEVDGHPAVVLTQLIGAVAVGDRVVMNTTAVDLGLGTGGWHVVHWNLARRTNWSAMGGGHVMKLRYTSLQVDTGAAEEWEADEGLPDLARMPVVACTVHSQVGAVAEAYKRARPDGRLIYVMTDGGALPLALSELVAMLNERQMLDGTITVGHAFGGESEAVNVPSALAIARRQLAADAVIVGMGPGVVGTETTLGTTALEAVAVLDITARLGGRPIIAVRASEADERQRHRGFSHHTRTVLQLTHARVLVPVPEGRIKVEAPQHEVVELMVPKTELEITTMGRTPAEDPIFFEAAAAAGVAAALGI
jgi:hypothetical protein